MVHNQRMLTESQHQCILCKALYEMHIYFVFYLGLYLKHWKILESYCMCEEHGGMFHSALPFSLCCPMHAQSWDMFCCVPNHVQFSLNAKEIGFGIHKLMVLWERPLLAACQQCNERDLSRHNPTRDTRQQMKCVQRHAVPRTSLPQVPAVGVRRVLSSATAVSAPMHEHAIRRETAEGDQVPKGSCQVWRTFNAV